jgi:glyoxylase-like metal-dependent hydrolase (beta-lactamase superfamily II)
MLRCLGILASVALAACSVSGGDGDDECAGSKCDDPGDRGDSGPDGPDGGAAACDGVLPAQWIAGGPDCGSEPAIQVHAYDPDTFILRQSLCTSPEGPFLYLLFGEDRALLEDTGDDVGVSIPLVDTVEQLLADRRADTGQAELELVVVNSHAHGDHVAYNQELEGRAGITVVGFTSDRISDFFDVEWPGGRAEVDLGGRVVDLFPIPGHEANHIALYDRRDQLLLTGDTLYPGRLFIDDFATYQASISRLVDFTSARPVCHVLGTHIEMTRTPGEEYDFGADHHPDEHELPLGRDHLLELRDALDRMDGAPARETHDDFVIVPL